MARVWKVLVLVVGLAAVACLAQSRLSYEEIVNLALRFFNQGRRGQPIFGLLEAIPPPSSVSICRPRPGKQVTPASSSTVRAAGRRGCWHRHRVLA